MFFGIFSWYSQENFQYWYTRSLGALRAPTSSWRPFGASWLRPLRPSGATPEWPTQKSEKPKEMVVMTPADLWYLFSLPRYIQKSKKYTEIQFFWDIWKGLNNLVVFTLADLDSSFDRDLARNPKQCINTKIWQSRNLKILFFDNLKIL